jgi:hypothetical protein
VRLVRTLVGITGALMLAACGADDSKVTTGEPPPPAGSEPHAAESDAVVLTITDVGGFVPPDRTFTEAPRLLVTSDGRVIQSGPWSRSIRARCCPTCSSGRSPRRGSNASSTSPTSMACWVM